MKTCKQCNAQTQHIFYHFEDGKVKQLCSVCYANRNK